MKVLNFGSLNYDNVYLTEHFVAPKETASSLSYQQNLGGKGFNQSIALARAGIKVYHAGKVGLDGQKLRQYLQDEGIDSRYLLSSDCVKTGHAIIEVCQGENRILLYGGANLAINNCDIDNVLKDFNKDDVLLIQNEISSLPYLIEQAHFKGLKIIMNVSPMNESVFTYPLDYIDMFIVNEVEAKALANSDSKDYLTILTQLKKRFPISEIVMTVGKDGVYYTYLDTCIKVEAYQVKAIDTTAAGDTFLGYFLASYLQNKSIKEALDIATRASAIAITKLGAAKSIPTLKEVNSYKKS